MSVLVSACSGSAQHGSGGKGRAWRTDSFSVVVPHDLAVSDYEKNENLGHIRWFGYVSRRHIADPCQHGPHTATYTVTCPDPVPSTDNPLVLVFEGEAFPSTLTARNAQIGGRPARVWTTYDSATGTSSVFWNISTECSGTLVIHLLALSARMVDEGNKVVNSLTFRSCAR